MHLLVRIETDVKKEIDATAPSRSTTTISEDEDGDSVLKSPAVPDNVANVLCSSTRSVHDAAGGEEDAPMDTLKEAFVTKCVDESAPKGSKCPTPRQLRLKTLRRKTTSN